jgi:hypothetical protein
LEQTLKDLLPLQITMKNALTLRQHKRCAALDCAPGAAFVASELLQFPRADWEKLLPALFQIVLGSPELKVEIESDLFKLVHTLVADFGKDSGAR